jgi:dTDP-4-dehydrorhamnose reductase
MRLLIIGSKGQLGSDLMRLAQTRAGFSAVGLDRPEIDVCDAAGLAESLDAHRPDTLVNLAAFHEVDRCETEGESAFAVNAVGVLNGARACAERGIGYAVFSSDFVFHDSPDKRPFTESDAPDPRSVYALSRLVGERLAALYHPNALIVRTCGLYGLTPPAGKAYNFPDIMLRLAAQKKPLRVIADQVCTPTFTLPLAETLLDCLEAGLSGLVHATCQGGCSWYEFAQAIFELAGVAADLTPCTTAEYGQAATRPVFSVLKNARLKAAGLDRLPHWREALKEYLKKRGQWIPPNAETPLTSALHRKNNSSH